jgi:LysR family transcriptional regulator, low CO2-responsive transcriptional regulator
MKHATFRQLKIFESAARHLNFSRAAEELHLTQPAISMQIKQIEEHAGVALFEQVGKKTFLTQAGEEVRKLALNVLSQVKDCEDALAALRGISAGHLDLAVVSTAKYFAPMLLSTFSNEHAGVTVKLSVNNREQVIQQLQENRVDLAIMGRPPRGMDAIASPFASHPHGIIASPAHPMARKRRIDLKRLGNENFLIREAGSGTRTSMEKVFSEHNVKPVSSMELASNETIKQAVMAGMGLAYLSLHTVGLELETGKLTRLDVIGTPVIREWYVIQRTGKKLSPIADRFREFLIARGAKLIEETTGVTSRRLSQTTNKSE